MRYVAESIYSKRHRKLPSPQLWQNYILNSPTPTISLIGVAGFGCNFPILPVSPFHASISYH